MKNVACFKTLKTDFLLNYARTRMLIMRNYARIIRIILHVYCIIRKCII